jgi:hypothetical protein
MDVEGGVRGTSTAGCSWSDVDPDKSHADDGKGRCEFDGSMPAERRTRWRIPRAMSALDRAPTWTNAAQQDATSLKIFWNIGPGRNGRHVRKIHQRIRETGARTGLNSIKHRSG